VPWSWHSPLCVLPCDFLATCGRWCGRANTSTLNSDLPLSSIALDFGFYDQSHFTRIFRQLTGTTPGMFRADHTPVQNLISVLHQLLQSRTHSKEIGG
jgi:AraC-like DNA-binding protein